LEKYRRPILIDEIQYAPGLLPFIKMEADEKGIPGDFWLTGSQQFQMMKGVSESLAGRVGIVHLQGFSRKEAEGRPHESVPFLPTPTAIEAGFRSGIRLEAPDLFGRIWAGGFPKVVMQGGIGKDQYFAAYVATYLQRDIRDLARVGDEMDFLKFMRAAAARTGQLLNLADLAKDTGVSPPTAKHWLSILVASGIVYLLEPWFTNLTKRFVKTPKLYFLDTGLCTYLTRWPDSATLEAGAMSGAILETWILSELLKGYWHNGREAPFYFYRDKDKKEIDLLIEQNGMLFPLEFKKTASPRKDDIRHFRVLERAGKPIGPGGLVCLAAKPLPLGEGVMSIPVSAL
jgi:predicted AAA+ superfamily ATPase